MFFSVIIPVYNVEKYLGECIDSVLRQTFTDFELILVDDGSTDGSPAICDEYAEKDGRVRVIHKENGGLSDARNAGTIAATGEYIVYIDSDDYLLCDTFLSEIYEHAEEKNSDIIMYKYRRLFADGNLEESLFSLAPCLECESMEDVLYEAVKADAYYGMAWTKAFKRSLAVEFEKNLLGEDMEWFFHLLTEAGSISAIDKAYIAYRQRAGSITATHKIKNLTDFIYILEKWSAYVKEAELSQRMKSALYGAMAKYYSNLFVVYARLSDRAKVKEKERIKALDFLLDYAMSERPQKIKRVYSLAGFNVTVLMLKLLDRLKG